MELLANLKSSKNYCESIRDSSFTQQISSYPKRKVYQNINDLFMDRFDPTCSILEEKDKPVYRKQRIIEIATDIDEKKETNYDKFKYSSKHMKSSVIQIGLQTPNALSSVLYLGDLYKVTPVIHLETLKIKVTTSKKTRENFHILYKDGSFMELDESTDFKTGSYTHLGECFVLNITDLSVYANFLNPIGKYKAPELIELAKKIQIPLEVNGKKKVKKQLYDDINVYYLNQA
jgi:hypothetical protein